MFRHIVLLTLHPDMPAAQRSSIVTRLRTLPDRVDTIRHYTVAIDAGLAEGNADISVTADFDDEGGWAAYRDHPDHQQIIRDEIAPRLASRVATQFELPT